MNTRLVFLATLTAAALLSGCSNDQPPLTEAQKGDVAFLTTLAKECEANPPKEGTQAQTNCRTAAFRAAMARDAEKARAIPGLRAHANRDQGKGDESSAR